MLAPLHLLAATAAEEGKKTVLMMLAVGCVFLAVIAIGELPLVKNVSPEFMQQFPIVYGNKQSSHLARGVAASYGTMRAEHAQPGGRFLEEDDVRLGRRVAFIGSEIQRKLFVGILPVGETSHIPGHESESRHQNTSL